MLLRNDGVYRERDALRSLDVEILGEGGMGNGRSGGGPGSKRVAKAGRFGDDMSVGEARRGEADDVVMNGAAAMPIVELLIELLRPKNE